MKKKSSKNVKNETPTEATEIQPKQLITTTN